MVNETGAWQARVAIARCHVGLVRPAAAAFMTMEGDEVHVELVAEE